MSGYKLNDDGTAAFTFEDFTRTLKRPTLRQYREAVESLGLMRDDVVKANPDTVQSIVKVNIDLVIQWFDEVFLSLAGEGFPRIADETGDLVIDEDRIAPWLLAGTIIAELVSHWQENPSPHGAR